MGKLTISMGGRQSTHWSEKLFNFKGALPKNMRRAMNKAGAILERQIVTHLNKYVRSNSPTQEFPAHETGTLARSVNFRVVGRGGNTGVIIGPKTDYAHCLETGSAKMRARPYVWHAWEKQKDKVIRTIQKTINGPLR